MLMHQHLVLRKKRGTDFMMILKEQCLMVTPNIRSLQEISMKKKIKKKTSKAWEHLEQGRKVKEEITQLNLQRNTN